MHLNVLSPWTIGSSEGGSHLTSIISQGINRGRKLRIDRPSYNWALRGKSMHLSPSHLRAPLHLGTWRVFQILPWDKNFTFFFNVLQDSKICFLNISSLLKILWSFPLPAYSIILLSCPKFPTQFHTPNFFHPQAPVFIGNSPFTLPMTFQPYLSPVISFIFFFW